MLAAIYYLFLRNTLIQPRIHPLLLIPSVMNPMNDSGPHLPDEFGSAICAGYETYTSIRFAFILIATMIAVVGVAFNVILVYTFITRRAPKQVGTPATLYPTVLAVLDAVICVVYILMFGADAVISYLRIENLFTLYYVYIIPAYVLSRIAQLAIPYMLIFATLERFVWTAGNIRNPILRQIYSTEGRYVTVLASVLICIALRMPTAFALLVKSYPDCSDPFRKLTTEPADWVIGNESYYIYDFHIMTIAQTVLPFIVLVILNMITVRKLCKKQKCSQKEMIENEEKLLSAVDTSLTPPVPTKDRKQSRLSTTVNLAFTPLKTMSSTVRNAIFTMVAIVTSYLLSNTLHLILTVLERTDSPLLKDSSDPLLSSTFHTFFSDLVSFVYMFTSAIRLCIYYLCNPAIRNDLQTLLLPPEKQQTFV